MSARCRPSSHGWRPRASLPPPSPRAAASPFDAIELGTRWYLQESVRSDELRRIGLLEGRRALGWELWREVVSPYGLRVLAETLQAAMDAGQMRRADPTALAHMLLAALHETSAIMLAAGDAEERERASAAALQLVQELRIS